MIIRSMEHSTYYRSYKEGLPGAGPGEKGLPMSDSGQGRTFEEYLMEAFQGEVVQKGNWVSGDLSDLSRKNIRRI